MKKSSFMFLVGVILLTFFMYCYKTDFNLYNIATDSGFDTSYDGDSGGGSSWGSSSSSSGGGSSFSGEIGSKEFWVYVGIATVFYVLSCFIKWIFGLLFDIINDINRYWRKKRNIKRSIKIRKKTIKENLDIIELSREQKIILNGCSNIFIEVQKAWTNFDYDELRNLVTDELYNMYYNQLQTLALKEQKNIMHDFKINECALLDLVEINKTTTIIKIFLDIEFYDYIVDNMDELLRGNMDKKVNMLYKLEFIIDTSNDKCPNCSADLEKGKSICAYCNTHILKPTNKVKMSKKELLCQF